MSHYCEYFATGRPPSSESSVPWGCTGGTTTSSTSTRTSQCLKWSSITKNQIIFKTAYPLAINTFRKKYLVFRMLHIYYFCTFNDIVKKEKKVWEITLIWWSLFPNVFLIAFYLRFCWDCHQCLIMSGLADKHLF